MSEPVLRVEELSVAFATRDGLVQAVQGVSFDLRRGETLGVVGESGSGKSVASLAVLGLLDPRSARVSGRVLLGDRDLLALPRDELRAISGRDVAMVFQDPFSCLHPMLRVGDQIVEAIRVHEPVSRRVARRRAIELLGAVGVPRPAERIDDHPHEYSGGMRQRAMIAMALVHNPRVLIADEPTTALDVTVQAQILDLLDRVKREFDVAVMLITHDLGVVASVAQRILVLYAGRAMELGTRDEVLGGAAVHPYTRGLLGSIPAVDRRDELVPIPGTLPSAIDPPAGCPFHPRCPVRVDVCDQVRPDLVDRGVGHPTACHLGAVA